LFESLEIPDKDILPTYLHNCLYVYPQRICDVYVTNALVLLASLLYFSPNLVAKLADNHVDNNADNDADNDAGNSANKPADNPSGNPTGNSSDNLAGDLPDNPPDSFSPSVYSIFPVSHQVLHSLKYMYCQYQMSICGNIPFSMYNIHFSNGL